MSSEKVWVLLGIVIIVVPLVGVFASLDPFSDGSVARRFVLLLVFGYPAYWIIGRVIRAPGRRRWLVALWALCIAVFLVGVPLTAGTHVRARLAKVEADARALASAVSAYQRHMGTLPASLSDLTVPTTNGQGQQAGPFIVSVPRPVPRYTDYRYERRPDGSWTITSTGDSLTVTVP